MMAKIKEINERHKLRRHYPFRRKFEENPYEAIGRLDKKLSVARAELEHWRFKLSSFEVSVTESIRQEIRLLARDRHILLGEIRQRYQEFLTAFPNANFMEIEK